MNRLIFFLIITSFISCEKTTDYKRIIQNDSDYDIWIINPYYRALDSTNTFTECREIVLDSIAVARKTSYVLEVVNTNRSVDFHADCPFICLDTLETRIHNRDSLRLNINLYPSDSNWVYTVFQEGEKGSCECRLIITNSSIE
ncbi:hypothetical protein [Aureispira sp. CCB-E]|uniref:hypothetical protein n=1 Tax=Aureispira sp. CCB-E TaxID=3051121 RepID=UPI00286918F9|nr:hypothetical protein [Aureispira sp. CCB-E]WMX12324.1 hypothetical protein QP953_15960 [Aureispira sp. CCB-E]